MPTLGVRRTLVTTPPDLLAVTRPLGFQSGHVFDSKTRTKVLNVGRNQLEAAQRIMSGLDTTNEKCHDGLNSEVAERWERHVKSHIPDLGKRPNSAKLPEVKSMPVDRNASRDNIHRSQNVMWHSSQGPNCNMKMEACRDVT